MKLFVLLAFVILFSVRVSGTHSVEPAPASVLSNLGNLDESTFSISGISAGGCMAVQFQYAWSTIVKAAGIVAAVPYMCAQSTLVGAEACMAAGYAADASALFVEAESYAAMGLIDPVSNLANHTIFLFSGLLDNVVPQVNMDNVASMYSMADAVKITEYFNYSAEHSWITNKYGNDCSYLGSPYVNNCGLDFAGLFLAEAFHNLGAQWNTTKGEVVLENMFTIDQTQFGANPLTNSLSETGYIYVPTQCQTKTSGVRCHLHLNLHGCNQDAGTVGTEYVYMTGINEWAESNNIVVVYPQTVRNLVLVNPNACFDWWGYAGFDYAQKGGVQISVLRTIISTLGGF